MFLERKLIFSLLGDLDNEWLEPGRRWEETENEGKQDDERDARGNGGNEGEYTWFEAGV